METKIKELQKLLQSDKVQHSIAKIKDRMMLNNRDITREEHYQIYQELVKEGYSVQEYLEHLKMSDKFDDEIVKNSKDSNELVKNLKKAGYTILEHKQGKIDPTPQGDENPGTYKENCGECKNKISCEERRKKLWK